MIRDITLGQYYPARSVIHQLDPRVKLVTTMIFIVSLFVAKGVTGYAIATVFLITVIRMSKVPFRFMTKGLKAILMILMLTVVFNLFLIDGDYELWRFGFLRITDKGLKTAVFMAVRLVYLILGSSIMTLTTTPNDLTDGLEKLLGPLKRVRVPVHEIAMMMSIALRFIPTLIEETQRIMNAQASRGVDLENGTLKEKIMAVLALIVPLFVSAFDRADQLANAMEARGYDPQRERTRYKVLQMTGIDYAGLAAAAAVLAGCIVLALVR